MKLNKKECKYVFRRTRGLIDNEEVVMRDPNANTIAIAIDNALTLYGSIESRIKYLSEQLNKNYIERYQDQFVFGNYLGNKKTNLAKSYFGPTLFTFCKGLRGINLTKNGRNTRQT